MGKLNDYCMHASDFCPISHSLKSRNSNRFLHFCSPSINIVYYCSRVTTLLTRDFHIKGGGSSLTHFTVMAFLDQHWNWFNHLCSPYVFLKMKIIQIVNCTVNDRYMIHFTFQCKLVRFNSTPTECYSSEWFVFSTLLQLALDEIFMPFSVFHLGWMKEEGRAIANSCILDGYITETVQYEHKS